MNTPDEAPQRKGFHELTSLTLGLVDQISAGIQRFVLGVAGPPGAGKSTVAHQIADIASVHLATNVAPMDGFHRDNAELERLGILDLKGIPASFDAAAFVDHVARLSATPVGDVIWPTYDRSRQEVVPAGTVVGAGDRLVVVEGNYLLLDADPWSRLAELLDEVWYLDVPLAVLEPRLLARQRMGRDESQAAAKVASTDKPNAALVHATRHRADLILEYEE